LGNGEAATWVCEIRNGNLAGLPTQEAYEEAFIAELERANPVGLVMTCAHYTDPKKPCQRCTRDGCAPCERCEKCQPDRAAVPASSAMGRR